MAQMSHNLPLQCRCGHVRGVAHAVSPSAGFRFVCYCTDCQTFPRFLNRPDVLDIAGGTDIFHMPMGHVKITEGMDAVRCLCLSSKVLRWYTVCCKTPIGNTAAGPGFPVVALIHSFMSNAVDGHSRDDILGPQLCRIFERSATQPLPPAVPPPPSFGFFVRRIGKILGWLLRGLGTPNPFFDDHGAPISEPCVLTPSERATLWSA